MADEQLPRPLTVDERRALDFVLSAEFDGVETLRRQALVAVVDEDWGSCCASIGLAVDPDAVPPADLLFGEVSADSKDRPARELLLLVSDGYLKSLEIVHYEEKPGPQAFPDPATFGPPDWID
jgi:hypothetical protein